MNNHSKLSLVLAEVDSVQFFTDAATGRSGISQSGLAVLCGVTKQSVSKLGQQLLTRKIIDGISPQQVRDNIFVTQTKMKLYNEQLAIAIIRYYYSIGHNSKLGCQAIGMPYRDDKKKKKGLGLEKMLQINLAEELNGEVEVATEAGRIDILTSTELIEVKKCKDWKAGVGQLLIYGSYYPSHQLRLHLFGVAHQSFVDIVRKHCDRLNIKVTFES